MIDFTTEFGKRADSRLKEDHIIWLTTVDVLGKPQPRPVWFLWDTSLHPLRASAEFKA